MGSVFTLRQAANVFDKLGVAEGPSDHHRRGFLVDDKTGAKLFPPVYFNKGRGDMYPGIARKFRKALRLNDEQFLILMSCSMRKEEYFAIRREKGD